MAGTITNVEIKPFERLTHGEYWTEIRSHLPNGKEITIARQEGDYLSKYEKLKEFVRGKWKGDCAECAAIANSIINQENP